MMSIFCCNHIYVAMAVFTLFAFVMSQSVKDTINQLPACSSDCIAAAAKTAGCTASDFTCQCDKPDRLLTAIGIGASRDLCLRKACGNEDSKTSRSLLDQICDIMSQGATTSSSSAGVSSFRNATTALSTSVVSAISTPTFSSTLQPDTTSGTDVVASSTIVAPPPLRTPTESQTARSTSVGTATIVLHTQSTSETQTAIVSIPSAVSSIKNTFTPTLLLTTTTTLSTQGLTLRPTTASTSAFLSPTTPPSTPLSSSATTSSSETTTSPPSTNIGTLSSQILPITSPQPLSLVNTANPTHYQAEANSALVSPLPTEAPSTRHFTPAAILAIAVGLLALLSIAAVLVFIFIRRRRRRLAQQAQIQALNTAPSRKSGGEEIMIYLDLASTLEKEDQADMGKWKANANTKVESSVMSRATSWVTRRTKSQMTTPDLVMGRESTMEFFNQGGGLRSHPSREESGVMPRAKSWITMKTIDRRTTPDIVMGRESTMVLFNERGGLSSHPTRTDSRVPSTANSKLTTPDLVMGRESTMELFNGRSKSSWQPTRTESQVMPGAKSQLQTPDLVMDRDSTLEFYERNGLNWEPKERT